MKISITILFRKFYFEKFFFNSKKNPANHTVLYILYFKGFLMRIDKETQKDEREKRQNKNTVGINDRRV